MTLQTHCSPLVIGRAKSGFFWLPLNTDQEFNPALIDLSTIFPPKPAPQHVDESNPFVVVVGAVGKVGDLHLPKSRFPCYTFDVVARAMQQIRAASEHKPVVLAVARDCQSRGIFLYLLFKLANSDDIFAEINDFKLRPPSFSFAVDIATTDRFTELHTLDANQALFPSQKRWLHFFHARTHTEHPDKRFLPISLAEFSISTEAMVSPRPFSRASSVRVELWLAEDRVHTTAASRTSKIIGRHVRVSPITHTGALKRFQGKEWLVFTLTQDEKMKIYGDFMIRAFDDELMLRVNLHSDMFEQTDAGHDFGLTLKNSDLDGFDLATTALTSACMKLKFKSHARTD